jgi:hypothetical protein
MCVTFLLSFYKNDKISNFSYCFFVFISFLWGTSAMGFMNIEIGFELNILQKILATGCIGVVLSMVFWVIGKKSTARTLGILCTLLILYLHYYFLQTLS